MTHFRFIPLGIALAAASTLIACNTAPAMPMGATTPNNTATSDQMAKMDAQMKTMQGMHEKMMNAKTPEERSKLMAEHMKAMQEGMAMMGGISGAGMGDMRGMQGMPDARGDIGARQQMMEKRMEMMQSMMKMMMDRMPAAPAR